MGRAAARGGFTLVELLIVIIIIGILAAIAVPMYLNQRDKAKETAVKGAVHSIELGIGTYGIDHGDLYPATGTVSKATLVDGSGISYVSPWPTNPWSGADMAEGVAEGDYIYTSVADTFTLEGLGKGGVVIMSVP